MSYIKSLKSVDRDVLFDRAFSYFDIYFVPVLIYVMALDLIFIHMFHKRHILILYFFSPVGKDGAALSYTVI